MDGLIDMKRSSADMKSEMDAMPVNSSGEQYPWGLSMTLDKEELDKLGIKVLPRVGSEVYIKAIGKITRASQSAQETPGGSDEESSVSVQITMMKAEIEEPEAVAETKASEKREVPTLLSKS